MVPEGSLSESRTRAKDQAAFARAQVQGATADYWTKQDVRRPAADVEES